MDRNQQLQELVLEQTCEDYRHADQRVADRFVQYVAFLGALIVTSITAASLATVSNIAITTIAIIVSVTAFYDIKAKARIVNALGKCRASLEDQLGFYADNGIGLEKSALPDEFNVSKESDGDNKNDYWALMELVSLGLIGVSAAVCPWISLW
ncbi:hypothetical protein [Rubinisphaera sp.]|uniref:hypothetical protein n=1 Tax=Rubinisphaera sp. TaxID=2024857 RepID=UPI000C11ABFB|nr:hypothetical protein [Rubinisphaera sp.]MBV08520.1 hypothetical protein [Rubinisphaera sp.]|tara:strand:+ start:3714 stop:4172 length:459 start_codon:yes stop_codon:yes gene_type:complete